MANLQFITQAPHQQVQPQPVSVVDQVVHQQTGGGVQQVSVSNTAPNPTSLSGAQTAQTMLRIAVAPTSPSAVEIFFGPSGSWGNGFPLAIGNTLALDGYVGPVYCVADPNGGGSADVRLITAVAKGA